MEYDCKNKGRNHAKQAMDLIEGECSECNACGERITKDKFLGLAKCIFPACDNYVRKGSAYCHYHDRMVDDRIEENKR